MRFVSLLMVSMAAMAAGVVFEPNRGQAGTVRAEFVARTREGNVAVRAGGLGGVRFVGADPRARGVGEGAAGVSHYMRGADPAQWVRGVPRYSRVRYAEVYRGIDVVYYDNGGGVEFDFLLAPGADAGQIVMEFPEAFAVGANGDLVSGGTPLRAPRAWQEVRGARKTVEVSFVARTARRAGLRIGAYDRRRPLVVDPTLEMATYLGGGDNEADTRIAGGPDGAGNLILGGVSPRTDLVGGPALPVVNPVPGVAQGQPRQAFVTKLNGQGAGVVFSTPLHGGGRESQVLDIRVGSDQSVHVLGVTDGALFPKVNALEVDEVGGQSLTFLAKLPPGGGAPLQASVWSGPDSAGAQTAGLALRPNGQPCVLNGGSLRLQQTAGALVGERPIFRTATLQCADDAGGKLALRTLLPGGGRYESIGMAADGAVLLAGVTNATLPVTPGVIQPTLRGGVIRLPGYPYTLPVGDAFAVKVSVANPAPRITMIDPPAVVLAEGSERTFSVYLYGTGFSGGMRITLNGKSVSGALLDDGRVELSGLRSSDFQGGTNRIAVTQTGPGGGSSEATIDGVYEPAVITRIVPPSVVQGAGATKVQIFVVNLSRESRLVWNGQERAAAYVGEGGYLEVTLSAGELTQAAAIRVAVRNAGAGVSPEGQFTVLAAAGADGPPVLTESFRVLGFGNGVTLGPTIDLAGSGFTRGTRAYWDGVAVAAELASATRLTIMPPAGDLGRLGMHEVYVENGGLRSVGQRIWVVRNVRPGLVAADRERPVLYVAETAGSDFTLLTLDARTGETVRTTPGIGTFVRAMALGDDGRYLYLVCRADWRLLRRYDTQAGRVDLEWTVSPLIGIIFRILPLPGTPAGLAVNGQSGVTIFDGDRERLANSRAAGFPATASPGFATASRLYLFDPLPGCWRWMEYDANGVSGGTPGCAAEAPADVVQDGRFVYLTDGKRAEVVTGPGADRGYVADPGRRRVWELSNGAGGARVVLHDLTTGEQSLQWLFGTTSPLRFSDFLLGADGSAVLYTPNWVGVLR